jgi:hypothetical protein
MAAADAASPPLYDRRFITLCTVVFLGFSSFAVIGPVLPILVLELGGNAALVGLIVAIYRVPSVLVRPFLGRLVDTWNQRGVWLLGSHRSPWPWPSTVPTHNGVTCWRHPTTRHRASTRATGEPASPRATGDT